MTGPWSQKRWQFRTFASDRQCAAARDLAAEISKLAAKLRVSPLIAELLLHRGLADPTAAAAFLEPKLTQMHDPTKLPGIDAACRRILVAIERREPIVIYGDYDVDGITASAILYHMLSALGAEVLTYTPHRMEEGYGLNVAAIDALSQGRWPECDPDAAKADARLAGRVPLMISVDCGITAVEPAAVAHRHGADLIITDHHHFDADRLPEAVALVHPGLPPHPGAGQEPYPFSDLCGAGVAFKLAWELARQHSGCTTNLPQRLKLVLLNLLSLAALGTIADVVPLIDENRVIAWYGLSQIKRTGFAGLNAMIDAARLRDEKIDAYHVGFVLGPRLNACGRMGHARTALHLLTEAQGPEAAELARFLTQENERRRKTEREIFDEAHAMVLEHGFDQSDRRAIVLGKAGWHQGVVGIVASRLVERFHRPVVMLAINEQDEAHGSARSVDGVSIHEAISACSEHLDRFGGHAMAAGLQMAASRIDVFREGLIRQVNELLPAERLTGCVEIDIECQLAQLDMALLGQLERLAPFGRANPDPVFCARNVSLSVAAQRIGKEGKHLRLQLRQNGIFIPAVAFGMGDLAPHLPGGVQIDVAFVLQRSTWQGRERLDVLVRDIKPSVDTLATPAGAEASRAQISAAGV